MLKTFYLLLISLVISSANSEVTFKNVVFKGYSVYTLKFTKTIEKSDSLKENVPKGPYDHVEFLDQYIPVLRENSVSDLDTLDELTIENCKLGKIQPGAFKNVPHLRRLNLKGNDLEKIDAGVFNHLSLSMLDLSKNRIKNIEASALDNLPNILNINLADNRITEWNKRWFHNTPLLTRISMQNNSLEKIPTDAFINIKGDKNYGSVKLTINLIFSHNKISTIEDNAFRSLKKINNLWLDYNELTEFKDTLLEGIDVKDLRIEHNQLHCPTGDLSKIIKAETTHMDDNPLDCECLEKIKKWATDHNKLVEMFFSDMNCLADRIRHKMDDLERRLKEINGDKEREDITTNNPTDQIELLEK